MTSKEQAAIRVADAALVVEAAKETRRDMGAAAAADPILNPHGDGWREAREAIKAAKREFRRALFDYKWITENAESGEGSEA